MTHLNRHVRFPVERIYELRGFTLIELLIVIAIILILVAIAVPNFMGARIRAQVTRVKADMKTIANALEMYRAQNHRYINSCYPGVANRFGECSPTFGGGGGYAGGFLWLITSAGDVSANSKGVQLTSPTPFLTEMPIDPFMTASLQDDYGVLFREAASIYYGRTLDWKPGNPTTKPTYGPPPYNILMGADTWVMLSYGPDYTQAGFQPGWGAGPSGLDAFLYSPTNGVKSYGDMYYYSDRGFLDEWKLSKSTPL